jgi:hypothetical protein
MSGLSRSTAADRNGGIPVARRLAPNWPALSAANWRSWPSSDRNWPKLPHTPVAVSI